jgi:PAS domain S-box-containing protein
MLDQLGNTTYPDKRELLDTVIQGVYNQSGVAILIADDDGNYLAVNPAAVEIFGYSEIEFSLMNVRDLKIAEGNKIGLQYKKFVKRGLEQGEFSFYNKDGDKKTLIYHAFQLQKDVNISIMIDITDQF